MILSNTMCTLPVLVGKLHPSSAHGKKLFTSQNIKHELIRTASSIFICAIIVPCLNYNALCFCKMYQMTQHNKKELRLGLMFQYSQQKIGPGIRLRVGVKTLLCVNLLRLTQSRIHFEATKLSAEKGIPK